MGKPHKGAHVTMDWPALLLILFLIVVQPAYANGGHMHLGGVFFLLLGGIIFIGGLVVICYLLFRAEPEATREERDDA